MEKASESYAQATVKSAGSALRRPNCLSFKADRILKREDLWKLLKEIDFPIKKVLGIAEMKGTQVDVTCTTRQNVLELQNKLAEVEYIKSIRLYESDIINVGIGWVPIPFNNEVIAEALSQRYGEVKKMTHRKDKEGLLSGMRIASMNKSDISVNPIPSYITIHGYEFYITYHGQQFTCKYCGEAGHKQVNCPKRKNDYPQLQNKTNAQRRNHGRETNETGSNLIRTSSPAPLARVEADPDKTFPCVGLQAGKDKQHNHENYTNIEAPTTTGHLSPRSEDNNPNLQKTNLKKRFRTSPEILPNSKSQSLCETPIPLICPECHTESFLAPDSTHFFCYKCKNDFSIVKACCDEETSILVPMKEKTINCPKCQSIMRWMPCCKQFQPEFTTEGNLFECIQCESQRRACWRSMRFLRTSLLLQKTVLCHGNRRFVSKVTVNKYDLIVVGGGSGGLACAKEAADLGKNVAVLDYVTPSPQGTRWDIGGTCVNVGCIPKKLMHQAALMRHQFANAKSYGWKSDVLPEHDWTTLSSAVQMYIRSLNWGHKVQLTEKNITYINGKGSFVDKNTIQAVNKKGKKTIIFGDNIVLAVGGRPRYPNIPGAEEHCISSDDIFWQQKPPGKTLVVGSSYVGLECAGFLHGLGFNTTLMIRSIPLRGFDQQIAHLITDHMAAEKMKIQWSQIPKSITKLDDGILSVESETLGSGETSFDRYDTVLLAIGRDPVTSSLDLDQAEVQVDEKSGKIIVDDEERTNIHNVYAIGDVAFGRPELTPVAIKAGKLLARRLFSDSNKLTDYENVPTTVFTPLEYSCVGLSEEDAIAKYGNSNVEVYHAFYKPLEYALPEQNHEQCYIKMVSFRDGSKPVIGLHFLGPNAGEVMQGFAVAMRCGVSRDKLASTVGIHPTCAEEIVKLHITKRSGLDPTVTGC